MFWHEDWNSTFLSDYTASQRTGQHFHILRHEVFRFVAFQNVLLRGRKLLVYSAAACLQDDSHTVPISDNALWRGADNLTANSVRNSATGCVAVLSSVVVEALSTSRKVACTRPDGVNEIFPSYLISSSRTRSWSLLNLWQKWVPEAEKCSWGLGRGRCIRLTALPPSVSDCLENVGSSISYNPTGLHTLLTGIALLHLRGIVTTGNCDLLRRCAVAPLNEKTPIR
jgi:hypothetical protein